MAFVGSRSGLGLGTLALCCSALVACSGDDAKDLSGAPGMPSPAPTDTAMPPTAGSGAGAMPADTTPLAGSSATPPAAGASVPTAGSGAEPPMNNDPPGPRMDECGLDTGQVGDEYCILPPSPDKGFQLRIGPTDYANPEPQFVLEPGQESTNSFSTVSGNTEDKYFYYREFRMRPGAHHNIITATGGGGGGVDIGHRIGTTNHLVEDSPKGGVIAPENEGVGALLAAKSPINVSLHSINTTEQVLIREVWVNFYYQDNVTEPVKEMFQTGDASFMIQPGQDTILGPFNCTLEGNGRMLWLYGHRHASNRRFSVWRLRGSQRDLIYEGYNWEEPMVAEYSTTVTNNTVPNEAMGIEAAWNGILDFQTGDQIEWECHVVNETQGVLRFTNNTFTGEMCIVDAELVGTNCGSAGGFGG